MEIADDVKEAIKRNDISPILKIFGTWAVTSYGIESLTQYYPIDKERIHELDWVHHLNGKRWVNISDFTDALIYARNHFAKKKNRTRKIIKASVRFDVFKKNNYSCVICGRSAKDGTTLHIDHIIPLANNGSNDISNLQVLCAECNFGKKTKEM